MFEKEAEERIKEKYSFQSLITREQGKELYQDGAEFGYNKANEWHYCKDELPDHNGQFYVALKGQTETSILNYDYDYYNESEKMVWFDDDDTNFDDEVYAWREKLKAPKEPKESE